MLSLFINIDNKQASRRRDDGIHESPHPPLLFDAGIVVVRMPPPAGPQESNKLFAYILRRMIYAIPILIGVNLLTFMLFFVVNSPDDMAVSQLGEKYVTPV